MFGNSRQQMEHFVKSHQWDKIGKKLPGADAETKAALAVACGHSTDEEAPNILINLLRDSNEGVQLQAVNSLGAIGNNSAKTHLQWLAGNLQGEKKELREAISHAISQLSDRK